MVPKAMRKKGVVSRRSEKKIECVHVIEVNNDFRNGAARHKQYSNWQQSTTPFHYRSDTEEKLLRYANIVQICTDIVCIRFELALPLSLTAMSTTPRRVRFKQ